MPYIHFAIVYAMTKNDRMLLLIARILRDPYNPKVVD